MTAETNAAVYVRHGRTLHNTAHIRAIGLILWNGKMFHPQPVPAA